ncbi:MAG: type II toxin-antitoxin system HigB family toxin [Proteobacteria bacterium]|nr:type II toxin-antitoxin system HigB family toxin [Pseudomonadota bacterium]
MVLKSQFGTGNKCRLIVAFTYEAPWGFVKFIGTHAEHDLINTETIGETK